LDDGSVQNEATATGRDPGNSAVSGSGNAESSATQGAHIKVTKSVAEATYSAAGDKLHYTISATNDGNTTLTGVTITDPLLPTLDCTPTQPATLNAGETM